MAETYLTQVEADALIRIDKVKVDTLAREYPTAGGLVQVPLISIDRREEFTLDLRRGRMDLSKVTHQLRGRQVIVLVRVDLGGPPHTNPDGTSVPCPHIHVYREGFADKWATPMPAVFSNPSDLWQTLQDFLAFCHVVEKPNIERGLFV